MKVEPLQFPCSSCGAYVHFDIESGKMECPFCKTHSQIKTHTISKHRYDTQIHSGINNIKKELSCAKCGAGFEVAPYVLASLCPYCKTSFVTQAQNSIKIDGLIPFKITHKQAQKLFKKWVGSLWFAPSAFTKYLDGDNKLDGVYVPHWSFDTDTTTHYTGQRGDAYYVSVRRTIRDANGRYKEVQVQERRIRWSPASGVVYNSFSDVTTPSSRYIDTAIVSDLQNWDHSALCGFSSEYLAGFEAQEHSIDLNNGFENAKRVIAPYIEQKIRYDIGGDEQRIHSIDTRYANTHYLNNLYPIWKATFTWKNKQYEYAINAQTGEVSGERPYSIVKIVFAILGVLALLGALYYADQTYNTQTDDMWFNEHPNSHMELQEW